MFTAEIQQKKLTCQVLKLDFNRMKWIKKGLIFAPSADNSSMVSHAAIPFVDLISENAARIYFSSRNIKGQSLPYYLEVNLDNLNEVTFINPKPIFGLGDLGTFDDNGIMPSCVVNYNNKKYLYYIGWNPQVTVSYRLSIGLAIGDVNGSNFKKYSKGPVCDRNLMEPFFNTAPFILLEDNLWRMWYISCTEWKIVNNYPEPRYHIKYAESIDGINWQKEGTVCVDYMDENEAIGRPCVVRDNNKYRMWYSYREILNYRDTKTAGYKIGYAESYDGKRWERKDKLVGIETSSNGWDSEMIEYCHVVKLNDKLHMFYNGNGFGRTGFGYAILDE